MFWEKWWWILLSSARGIWKRSTNFSLGIFITCGAHCFPLCHAHARAHAPPSTMPRHPSSKHSHHCYPCGLPHSNAPSKYEHPFSDSRHNLWGSHHLGSLPHLCCIRHGVSSNKSNIIFLPFLVTFKTRNPKPERCHLRCSGRDHILELSSSFKAVIEVLKK